ncbi:MAG: hypothetical protein AAGN35_06880 [Bacteroidota bacterium]
MRDSLFDAQELDVLSDARFFESKLRIDAKITSLFSELKAGIEADIAQTADRLPEGFPRSGSRIYRGEHHGPYPWRAVDCPAGFHGQDHLAFRCLLLWGHAFSFHFFLRGKWLTQYLPRMHTHFAELAATQLELSRQDDPWKWRFDRESHRPLAEITPEELDQRATATGFLKLSRRHPLAESATLVKTGRATWRTLQRCLLA